MASSWSDDPLDAKTSNLETWIGNCRTELSLKPIFTRLPSLGQSLKILWIRNARPLSSNICAAELISTSLSGSMSRWTVVICAIITGSIAETSPRGIDRT